MASGKHRGSVGGGLLSSTHYYLRKFAFIILGGRDPTISPILTLSSKNKKKERDPTTPQSLATRPDPTINHCFKIYFLN